jgi:uncharacterized membrane protein
MLGARSRFPAALAFAASLLGLLFASYSTVDYAAHLDRRLHDVHCSVIPGVPATSEAEGCRAAMYSPYSALLKEAYWGGIPISLFAMGAFTFFAGFSLYLLVANGRAPRKAVGFFAAISVTPLLVSMVMFTISITRLGHLCQTCVGIYLSSFILAVGGLLGLLTLKDPVLEAHAVGNPRPAMSWLFPFAWLVALTLITLVPSLVYAASVPDHRAYLARCGELPVEPTPAAAPLEMRTGRSIQATILFEDPLCPTCQAFHDRVVHEDIMDKLDAKLFMFPLDSECNWMLSSALHPGACTVSKAVICGGDRARHVLEWAYDQQEALTRAGKAGKDTLRAAIQQRWGSEMITCIDDMRTQDRLNRHLHFAAENSIPVSTPQMYLGKKRICDEDTDIGLRYTMARLAPEVLR